MAGAEVAEAELVEVELTGKCRYNNLATSLALFFICRGRT